MTERAKQYDNNYFDNDINNAAAMISPMLVVIWSYPENRDLAL